MKLYMVRDKRYPLGGATLCAWSITETVPPNGVAVKAVHFFTRRKHAKAWLANFDAPSYYEIKAVEVN